MRRQTPEEETGTKPDAGAQTAAAIATPLASLQERHADPSLAAWRGIVVFYQLDRKCLLISSGGG